MEEKKVCITCGEEKDINRFCVVQRTETKLYRTRSCSQCVSRRRDKAVDKGKKAIWTAKAMANRKEKIRSDPAFHSAWKAKRNAAARAKRAEAALLRKANPEFRIKKKKKEEAKQPIDRHRVDGDRQGRGRPTTITQLVLTDPKPERPVKYLPAQDWQQDMINEQAAINKVYGNKQVASIEGNVTKEKKDETGRHILHKVNATKDITKEMIREVSDAVNKDMLIMDSDPAKHIRDLHFSVTQDSQRKYIHLTYEVSIESWEDFLSNQRNRHMHYTLPRGMNHVPKD